MRKVELNLKENMQYEIIKKLVETSGNKKRATIKLNCTQRHINRLIKKYKDGGKEAFVHGNTGKDPANKINNDTRTEILDIYCKEIPNANFRHATELLEEHFNIQVSDTTLNTILRGNYIISPKAHRMTKRKMKKHLKDLRSKAHKKSELVELETKLEELDRVDAHPRRTRSAYFGELIQMDASKKIWFDNISMLSTCSD